MKLNYRRLKKSIPIQVLKNLNLDNKPFLKIIYPEEEDCFLELKVSGLSDDVFFRLHDIHADGKMKISYAPQSMINVNSHHKAGIEVKTVNGCYTNWIQMVEILRQYYTDEITEMVDESTVWVFNSLYSEENIDNIKRDEIRAEIKVLRSKLTELKTVPIYEKDVAEAFAEELENDEEYNKLTSQIIYEKVLLIQAVIIKNTPRLLNKLLEGFLSKAGGYIFTMLTS